jgi:hypothetical protein
MEIACGEYGDVVPRLVVAVKNNQCAQFQSVLAASSAAAAAAAAAAKVINLDKVAAIDKLAESASAAADEPENVIDANLYHSDFELLPQVKCKPGANTDLWPVVNVAHPLLMTMDGVKETAILDDFEDDLIVIEHVDACRAKMLDDVEKLEPSRRRLLPNKKQVCWQ